MLALLVLGARVPGGAGDGLDFPTYDGLDRVLPVTLKNYKAMLKRFPVLALLHHHPSQGDRAAQRHSEMEELILEVGTKGGTGGRGPPHGAGDTIETRGCRWDRHRRWGTGTCVALGTLVGTRDTGAMGSYTHMALGTLVGTRGSWWERDWRWGTITCVALGVLVGTRGHRWDQGSVVQWAPELRTLVGTGGCRWDTHWHWGTSTHVPLGTL